VRRMVVECEIVVYDGVVGMIGLEQVLERSRSLFRRSFDVVNLYRRQVDFEMWRFACAKKGRQ